MTPDEALDIVANYGAAIERYLGSSMVAPKSALPCDKETIKTAIRASLLYDKNILMERMDRATVNYLIESLRFGYQSLAHFLPDEDARQVAEWEREMQDLRRNLEAGRQIGERIPQSPDTGLSDRALELLRKTSAEEDRLATELWEWEKSVGLRHPSEDLERAKARAAKRVDKMMKPALEASRRRIEEKYGVRLGGKQNRRWWQFWRR